MEAQNWLKEQKTNLVTSEICVKDLKDWVCIVRMYYQGLQSSLNSKISIFIVHFQHGKRMLLARNKKKILIEQISYSIFLFLSGG